MSQLNEQRRQLLGCGFAPQPSAELLPSVRPWQNLGYSSLKFGRNPAPSICPGYTCNLPETIEVARARLHWSKGQLTEFLGGPASESLMQAIEVLEGSTNGVEAWRMTPEKEGGGGK